MRPSILALAVSLVLAGCEGSLEKLPGHLAHVSVITVSDTCTPLRATGDGGLQFWGQRPDGGLVFSVSLYSQFGPTLDGGGMDSARLDTVPASAPTSTVGTDSACAATVAQWSAIDGGLRLDQTLPGFDGCPSGPLWLPATACTVTRQFLFDPASPCSLDCVRVSASGDVSCGC